MNINLHPATVAPIYAQVRDQIVEQITSGVLAPGSTLMPPAALAQKLSIDTGEIQRAYFELIQEGLVASVKKKDFMHRDKTTYTVVRPKHPKVTEE
jgi:GntR family transcriptional regulator